MSAAAEREAREIEDQLLGSPAKFSQAEASMAAGVPVQFANMFWTAMGLEHDERKFLHALDVRALAKMVDSIREGHIDQSTALHIVRLVSHNAEQIAHSEIEGLTAHIAQKQQTDQLSAKRKLVDGAEIFVPQLENLMIYSWRKKFTTVLKEIAQYDEENHEDEKDPGLYQWEHKAIGFVDLASYSAITENLEAGELVDLIQKFEMAVAGILVDLDARFVKSVGDSIMFTAADSLQAAQVALTLVERIGRDPLLPSARAAFCFGSVVQTLGDVYGPTVNKASRVLDAASSGEVYTDQETARVLNDSDLYITQEQELEMVKSFGKMHLHHVLPVAARQISPQK